MAFLRNTLRLRRPGKGHESVGRQDQPVISDPMPETGRMHLQSELLESLEHQRVPSDVSNNVCFTLRNGNVEAGSVMDEAEKHYGQIGLDILRSIISAAESPGTSITGNGTTITLYYESVVLVYHDLSQAELQTIRSALAWLCLLQRNPNTDYISISRGSWTNSSFHLEPLAPVTWTQCCWSNMLSYGIVADFGNDTPQCPLLKAKPPVMLYLAGFVHPRIINGGYMFIGVYSALVPMARNGDRAILWHFESKKPRGEMLDVTRMQCLRRRWLRVTDLESLVAEEAYVGWSAGGGLCLATDVHFHDTTWARRVGNPKMWTANQLNLQISARLPHSINLTMAMLFNQHTNRVEFDSVYNFDQQIHDNYNRPWILYDVVAKRAWLVPMSSLLHFMIFLYCSFRGKNNFPPASLSTRAEDSRNILLRYRSFSFSDPQGSHTVEQQLHSFMSNLHSLKPRPLRGNRVSGYQLMDIVHGLHEVDTDTFNLEPRANWSTFLKAIPCLVGANMGGIIVGNRSQTIGSACNHLITGHNFLGATVSPLNTISTWQGQVDVTNSSVWTVPGGVWVPSDTAFVPCDHERDGASDGECWKNSNIVQSISNKKKGLKSTVDRVIPENGVVVFGGENTRWWQKTRFRASLFFFAWLI